MLFTFTRDLAPIHCTPGPGPSGASFICPLPVGTKTLLEQHWFHQPEELAALESFIRETSADLNRRASLRQEPFENILFGYEGRKPEELEDLLKKHFSLNQVMLDQRGVYVIQAGLQYDSGDVYLATDCLDWYDYLTAEAFKGHFQDRFAFQCHNVDYYWQALLTREFAVRYFNWLQAKIAQLKKLGVL